MIDSIIDETTKDLPSGDMLLKIITAEKARLARMVLKDGSSSRKTSDTDWLRGIGLPGSQSGSTLKPEVGPLSNETSDWQSTSLVQVGWFNHVVYFPGFCGIDSLHSSCVMCMI